MPASRAAAWWPNDESGNEVKGCGASRDVLWCAPASPPCSTDIANETAFKVRARYTFPFGLALSGYEYMHPSLPQDLPFQNERQRNGLWFAASQEIFRADNVSIGWAHAGRTPGDPGGQHNFNPTGLFLAPFHRAPRSGKQPAVARSAN